MALTKVRLKRFTAFSELELALSPGINVLVGANGTGKTHLMKICYAACDVSKTGDSFVEKLVRVFLPAGRDPRRLVKRPPGRFRGEVEVYRGEHHLDASFSSRSQSARAITVDGADSWMELPMESVYIPVKEMLANAPGFLSLYASHEVHFEEVYRDILLRASRPALREPLEEPYQSMLANLGETIDGKVVIQNEEFFLRNAQANLEFSLLAEGMRKLALLWLLIRNGTLRNGSVLFWDEPEANLNPKMFGQVIDVLLELQRTGVQVFLATHDYVILEEIDLRKKEGDAVAFHSFYRDAQTDDIACNTASDYLGIHPNAIADAFTDLYDREIERSLGIVER